MSLATGAAPGAHLLLLVIVPELEGVVEEDVSLPLVEVAVQDAEVLLAQPPVGVVLEGQSSGVACSAVLGRYTADKARSA